MPYPGPTLYPRLTGLYPEAPAEESSVATTILVREPMPSLSVNFDLWDGRTLRAGPDEGSVLGVPTALTFQTEMPGGFGPANITLPRPDWWDPMDGGILAGERIGDAEGRNAHEGRVVAMPHTGVNEIQIQTEGWSKATEDNETAHVTFRNIDKQSWTGASTARKQALGNDWIIEDPSVEGESDIDKTPVLVQTHDGPWAHPPDLAMLAHYDSGPGNPIGEIYYQWKDGGGVVGADWHEEVRLDDTDAFGGGFDFDAINNLVGGSSNDGTLAASNLTRRFAELAVYYAAGVVGDGNWAWRWPTLAVMGLTGLTKMGTEPNAGFLVTDMVRWMIENFVPALNITPDSIEQTSFLIPHADYRDPQTTRAIIESMLLFGGNYNSPLDWGVYDNREFFMKSPGTYGTEWRARRGEGLVPDNQGQDASSRFNGARITYNPGDGTSVSVGPVGSGSTYETDLLEIQDRNHPATRAGLRKWTNYDAAIMNKPGAILTGQMILAEKNRDEWRGSLTASGMQRNGGGSKEPAYMMRSGHQVVDETDQDTRPRRIVGTDYDDSAKTCQVSIGQPPNHFDVLLARAGVVLSGKGLG